MFKMCWFTVVLEFVQQILQIGLASMKLAQDLLNKFMNNWFGRIWVIVQKNCNLQNWYECQMGFVRIQEILGVLPAWMLNDCNYTETKTFRVCETNLNLGDPYLDCFNSVHCFCLYLQSMRKWFYTWGKLHIFFALFFFLKVVLM